MLSLTPIQNRILAALPEEEYLRLLPHLELVTMPAQYRVFEVDAQVAYVHFPIDCIVSLISVLENGATTEFAMVGNEGLLGIYLLMGRNRMPYEAMVQSPGHGYRIKAQVARTEFMQGGRLFQLALQYMQVKMTQLAQIAVCNRHHQLEQQLCRWLLSSMDRLGGSELAITHERIAQTLGVRREGVTTAAGKLQVAGLIECSRGHIKIIDRLGLEQQSCECYGVMKKAFEGLLFSGVAAASVSPQRAGINALDVNHEAIQSRRHAPGDHLRGV